MTNQISEVLRQKFEAIASDSYGFKRSRKGTYVNASVARDWKWFNLGISAATPAPASDSADGFLPLPEPAETLKVCEDDAEWSDYYTADQMHAYVLADRAARQVHDDDNEVVADIRDAISKDRSDGDTEWSRGVNSAVIQHVKMIDAAIARRRAARQSPAAPEFSEEVIRYCTEQVDGHMKEISSMLATPAAPVGSIELPLLRPMHEENLVELAMKGQTK